ncbi:MAG: sulfatase-like hydrolase/transferase [Planctomycetes bacterium]|nr:sulfatase-like hydrolase/transferase [Planctomycetota bacterium]
MVLVLVDQLRHDAAERWLTETHALAKRGVRFEAMRAVAPWTYPSVISLFSGLYPQQHGADGNQEGGLLSTFADEVPLLPRTLRAAGYRTAGFVTNPFLHEWNPVHRAFDHYDASFIHNQGPTRGHGELVWTERMYADSVNTALLAHYEATPCVGPEFTYVHYIDVHGRAEGPERWKDAPFEHSYAGAVRYVDAKIRELHEYFSRRYGGQLLFLVTSDHGQDEGDDLELGEGKPWRKRKASLHDFNLHVPLYVLPGADVPAGVIVSAACANIDVTPTVLAWLGLPPHANVPGRSLLGALRGEPYDGERRCLYARNSAFGRFEEAVVHGGLKYVRYREPRRALSLFDLATDPRESQPVQRDTAAVERCLEEAADVHGLSFPARYEPPAPELSEQLRRLGYGGEDDEAGQDEGKDGK